jgi:hypothetical protein
VVFALSISHWQRGRVIANSVLPPYMEETVITPSDNFLAKKKKIICKALTPVKPASSS